jgi:hypothetical protein
MEQPLDELISDDLLDERLAAEDDANEAEQGQTYVPDPRTLWGSEAARAMLVVLTRRLGPDFAREVSNELASRTLGYQAGCPDDRRDARAMQTLICDPFWDQLFALVPSRDAEHVEQSQEALS